MLVIIRLRLQVTKKKKEQVNLKTIVPNAPIFLLTYDVAVVTGYHSAVGAVQIVLLQSIFPQISKD